MKFSVYDSGKLADSSHPNLENVSELFKKQFQNAVFDTFDGAVEYAHEWLGPLLSPKSPERFVANQKYFYFKNNFCVEIVSSEPLGNVQSKVPTFDSLIGKTIIAVDAKACNVVHLDFSDGSGVSVTYTAGPIPGLSCLTIEPKWLD